MIQILDTTLRDGCQREGIAFSAHDKLKIAKKLDALGIHYIEGGWPGSNPKDKEFFAVVKKNKFKNACFSAFCSTHYKNLKADKDPNLLATISSGVKTAVVFGKTWDFHATKILEVSLSKNLELIYNSVKFLRIKGLQVIFDAEHFFDGYKSNPAYSIKCLQAAQDAGAFNLTLCDTNGGSLPSEIKKIVNITQNNIKIPIGIHAHNDSGLATANSLAAVEAGVQMVQGTINGYGERAGNADLCSVIPNLQLKMGYKIISDKQLKKMTHVSAFVQELANLNPNKHLPFVGKSAFSHKGGIHVSAFAKSKKSYQHIDPQLVGNESKITVSELSGKSNIIALAKEYNIHLKKKSSLVKSALAKIKGLENQGFQFEGAEASFALILARLQKNYSPPFNVLDFMTITDNKKKKEAIVEATIEIEINKKKFHTAGRGNGPVNALDEAFRKAILSYYPKLKKIELFDYKVRILDAHLGTGAKTRVLIESGNKNKRWTTVGCSYNIIDASMTALIDSFEYGILYG